MHLLLPFGDHLISVDKDNVVIIWDVESEGWFFCCFARFTFISCSRINHIFTVYVICSVNLTADTYLQISYDKASFEVSALMHPSTYLNKILFGSSQGSLQLWNIKSKYALLMDSECTVTSITCVCVYTVKSWNIGMKIWGLNLTKTCHAIYIKFKILKIFFFFFFTFQPNFITVVLLDLLSFFVCNYHYFQL